MQATREEVEWASRIKRAARQDPTINQAVISDLEYLHHAIVAKDQVGKALKRLRNMQIFKESHGIQLDGSYAEAERDIKLFLTSHPDMMLSVAAGQDSHHMGVFCGNYSGLKVQRIQSEEAYCVLMRGMFYILQAGHANIAAMRAGSAMLLDLKGAGVSNFSLAFEERAAQLYSHAYPSRVVHIVNLRAPLIMRLLFNLIRYMMSKSVRQRVTHTAKLEEWLKQSPYPATALPEAWGGTLPKDALYDTLLRLIRERYDNAAKFKLPSEEDDDN